MNPNSFRFYIVYKGEYNHDNEIGIRRNNIERLRDLLDECNLLDGLDEDYAFLHEVISACDEILEEVDDDE